MRRTRQKHEAVPVAAAAGGWHEGAHWVAGAGAVVHAPRADELATEVQREAEAA